MTTEGDTGQLYEDVTRESRTIFEAKLEQYGPSLMIFRVPSLVDKLWIKAHRIRQLEEIGEQRQISEGRRGEYLALVNYSTVLLMKLWHADALGDEFPDSIVIDPDELLAVYDSVQSDVETLLMKKNHDYDEAWREMHIESLTDIILDKILRVKSQLDREERVSNEDVASEVVDILNYAVFSVDKLDDE